MNEIKSDISPARDGYVGTRPVRPDGVPKVTGAARYGSDYAPAGMIHGKVLRSPHAHARIRAIDTSKAEALPGVHAVVTGADFPDFPDAYAGPERIEKNMFHESSNVMARGKVFYHGHALAAVAARDEATAKAALKLIEVDYEVLPHVISIDEAIAPGAPQVHDGMTTRNVTPAPTTHSNITRRWEDSLGDVAAGFAEADEVVELSFDSVPVHQGYIEPHACVAEYETDGSSQLWVSSQGHFTMRDLTAKMTGMSPGDIRASAAEIGGGFGGKTKVYLEPVAMMLSKKAGLPVKMTMSRDEVFRATGPASDSKIRVKIGAKRDGTITAGEIELYYNSGAFPGAPFINGCLCAFGQYNIANQHAVGHDVLSNRAMTAAYRAPGSTQSCFAVEGVLDVIAKKIGMDPIDLRLKNAITEGTRQLGDRTVTHNGFVEILEALKAHPDYAKPLGPNQGRGVAAGYWHNMSGHSGATCLINSDGVVTIANSSPDIGGSRASMAMMAADTLGVPYEDVRSEIHDTASVPYGDLTGGSRVTFATGKAIVGACEEVIDQLKQRAAEIWGVEVEAVEWAGGAAHPSSTNVGKFEPLTLKELAADASATGGHFGASYGKTMSGHAPGLSAMFCDVEVDPDTGATKILNFVSCQDAGRAIHPAYVEGQMQGACVQGIGWALNEGYVYGKDGVLQNSGWLDYRMPVASDLPMLQAIIVEVPNPFHPFGVKGVAEASMVSALGCVANAVSAATRRRMTSLPMNPQTVLKALDERGEEL
ncbi:xanthine dehydrogenase family protein molybdopterin-binding subunit [Salipiger bermudensis]|uniref:xanthine dehydrogenase family protein molybdopterin-binding subunit n=1 Tax=Salipiger bermudensis TaxID=344736 RepID=UPI001CD36174|nr:xanthine dehydrogenase family protein molybdopterin-binding subunit [Salipiger bermudensis]MCA1283754.1 xanthine dehydrogenase family protein molybdopterin-binding subunit [Salipiger bermudensis]